MNNSLDGDFSVRWLNAIKPILGLFVLLLVAGPSHVNGKGHRSSAQAPYTVIEADAVSVTVSVGKTGDVDSQKTFKINDYTGVMIDGVHVPARDLKGGMQAFIDAAADGVTATWINAHDPRKH